MNIESIDEGFSIEDRGFEDISYSKWNGRDVEYPTRLSKFDGSDHLEFNKNFLSHGVKGIRHAGRNVERAVKKHKKAVIVAAAVVVAVVVIIATGGTGTPEAIAGVAGAAATPGAEGKRKRDEDEPDGSPPAASAGDPPPKKTTFNFDPPAAVATPTPNWRTTPTFGMDSNAPPSNIKFEIPGKPLARGAIGGINGMGNNLDQARANGTYLSNLSGNHQIDWVHNRTNSIPVDIAESVMLNYKGISAPANELKENWMKFHTEHMSDPDAKYLQVCHSQGALHVRNALQEAPQEIRERIIVVAIAPATVVPESLCFASYNYASKRDPIVYGEAAFNYDADASYEERMAEPSRQALKELVLLEPHPDAPLFDHSFDSPTFVEVIKDHLDDHIKQFGYSE